MGDSQLGQPPADNHTTRDERGDIVDDYLRKRMLAVNVLLEIPEDIPDVLETELYAYRDRLEAEALSA